jgi:phage-related protein
LLDSIDTSDELFKRETVHTLDIITTSTDTDLEQLLFKTVDAQINVDSDTNNITDNNNNNNNNNKRKKIPLSSDNTEFGWFFTVP